MANIKQAVKRARQQKKRRLYNMSKKSAARTTIKKFLTALKAGSKDAAQAAFKVAATSLDRLAGKNIIHANKAARLKSRLNKKLQTLQ